MQNLDKITGRLGNRLFQFAYIYSKTRDEGIDYYVQDEKYFKKYEDDIRFMFSEGITEIDAVSIHIRRGDYLLKPHSDFHTNLCETDYYERAKKYFNNVKNEFVVFSDDIKWCKENLEGNLSFFESGSEIEDFNNMASCKHHIIANSSYSWWAAWLGKHEGGITIAPKENTWYKDGIIRCKLPKEWVQI